MAREDRTTPPALGGPASPVDGLLADASSYAFFQALRLVRLRMRDSDALRDAVRVRPALSLAFPETDIESIQRDDEGHYRIEANFFGLYGVTSPLPTFYTEDLIDEALQGASVTRDFLDIIHAALYPLLFNAWEKYRIWLAVTEHRDTHRLQQLHSLIGLAGQGARGDIDPTPLLPFAGNLSWFPRSALGLQGLLCGMLDGAGVSVEPCVTGKVTIPVPARGLLGLQAVSLGEDALIGQEMLDRSGNLAIVVGPLSAERFHELLPGHEPNARLVQAIALYLEAPLRCELGLVLDPAQRTGSSLGTGWQQLGYDTWLGDGDPPASHATPGDTEPPVWFPLALGAMRDPRAPAPHLSSPQALSGSMHS